MNIYWLGHSCFLIKTSIGKRILTDPFDIDMGYSPFKGKVDVVTISHLHFDHSYIKNIDKDTLILDELESYESEFLKINSFPSFHDNCQGMKRGPNLIFKYQIDGLTLCHLGDLGHTLHAETIKSIGYIDALFIPVGSNFTLNIDDVKTVIEMIRPRFIIPMHYKTKDLNFHLNGVDEFLRKMKNYKKINMNVLSLNKDSLPNESTIIILDISNIETI